MGFEDHKDNNIVSLESFRAQKREIGSDNYEKQREELIAFINALIEEVRAGLEECRSAIASDAVGEVGKAYKYQEEAFLKDKVVELAQLQLIYVIGDFEREVFDLMKQKASVSKKFTKKIHKLQREAAIIIPLLIKYKRSEDAHRLNALSDRLSEVFYK